MAISVSASCRLAAMNLLARREHTQRELRQKLLQRGFATELIAATIADLATQGLQSDEQFALSYARMRAGRGFGPLRIGPELGQRGVSSELIEIALHANDLDWPALRQRALHKKFGKTPSNDFIAKSKQQQFLLYRGFTQSSIEDVTQSE